MSNREINLKVVAEIANALGDLNSSVVFIGGAVVSVYVEDDAADEVRPTEDVDITLKLVNLSQREFDRKLASKGFHLDLHGHALCTYLYKGISVDIMSVIEGEIGSINRWYRLGFESIEKIVIDSNEIQIFSAPCFIATKFDAFNDRGNGDHRFSHDFEDIIYVIDNREALVDEIENSDPEIREYLQSQFQEIIESKHSEEILSSHLNPLLLESKTVALIYKMSYI